MRDTLFKVKKLYFKIEGNKEVTVSKVVDNSYEKIVIPSYVKIYGDLYNVTKIGDFAFFRCNRLKSVSIPNSVKVIDKGAFRACEKLTSVKIPDSVTEIGICAFYNCVSLTTILIPNSVKKIGLSSFSGCEGLTSLTISNSISKIEDNAVGGCRSLKSITIPDSITEIGDYAFSSCERLESIIIPQSVKVIGEGAFKYCYCITSVTIPKSVVQIRPGAFSFCKNLTSINVEKDNSVYDSRNNCDAVIETSTNTLIVGCKSSTLASSLRGIGKCAFMGCAGLNSIVIPSSVTFIGESAFKYCEQIESFTIPKSVKKIGSYAFDGSGVRDMWIEYNDPKEVILDTMAFRIPLESDLDDFPKNFYIKCTLHVPESSLDAFKSVYEWRQFEKIEAYFENLNVCPDK